MTDEDGVETTYVFEQAEVRATGRTAVTTLSSGKTEISHEITPVETMVGSWKKWVNLAKLPKVNND